MSATTGVPVSINAIGPCFNSPPANPSACIYANSFNFSAPSNAVGYPTCLPKNRIDCESLSVLVNSRSGSTVSSTCSTFAGNSDSSSIISLSNFFLITFSCLPISKPIKYIAISWVAKALVEATAISGPAWV